MVSFRSVGKDFVFGVDTLVLNELSLDPQNIYIITIKEDLLSRAFIRILKQQYRDIQKEKHQLYDHNIRIYTLPKEGEEACRKVAEQNLFRCVHSEISFVGMQGAVCALRSDRVFLIQPSA